MGFEFSVVGAQPPINKPVIVKFKDGLNQVPDWVVHLLGGEQKIRAVAPRLINITFDDWMSSFAGKTLPKQAIGSIFRSIRRKGIR